MKNKFRDRIIKKGIATGAHLVLPESNDSRILDAKRELTQLGFNIMEVEENPTKLAELKAFIASLKFTKNWTNEQLKAFMNNSINIGMAMVANGDADGLVAGAATATGAAAETPHFSSRILLNSAASTTDNEDKSSTILFKSAINFSPF